MKLRLATAALVATTSTATADRQRCSPTLIAAEIDQSSDELTGETADALRKYPRTCLVGGLVLSLREKSWKAAVVTKKTGITDPLLMDALTYVVIHNNTFIDSGFGDVLDALRDQANAASWGIAKLGKLIGPNIDSQAQVLALQLLGAAGPHAHTQLPAIALAADSTEDDEVRETARAVLASLLAASVRSGGNISVTRNAKKKEVTARR